MSQISLATCCQVSTPGRWTSLPRFRCSAFPKHTTNTMRHKQTFSPSSFHPIHRSTSAKGNLTIYARLDPLALEFSSLTRSQHGWLSSLLQHDGVVYEQTRINCASTGAGLWWPLLTTTACRCVTTLVWMCRKKSRHDRMQDKE
jgi:hypothetical protein